MTTVRLVIVLLLLGVVVLLAVQNTSPVLPLVLLGGQTVALPLSVWMVGAIALGALTTLGFTALLGSSGRGVNRSRSYKYRPQPFYEPVDTTTAARDVAEDMSTGPAGGRFSRQAASGPGAPRQPRDNQPADSPAYGREWQDWTNLQSANQWNNWDAMEQSSQSRRASASERSGPASASGAGIGRWLFGNRKAAEEEQVNQSWQELSDDWGDMEHREYRTRGVSPVDENLDDINRGWEDASGYASAPADFEVPQSPKRVYQDGSLYSYSYRNQDGGGQRDNIYGPSDDVLYGDEGFDRDAYVDLSQPEDYREDGEPAAQPSGYGTESYGEEDLGEPEVAEDGVVDADYRVIIPPSPSSDDTPVDSGPDAGPELHRGTGGDDDDWSDAEDALTP